jgi:hypothetical protein
MDNEQKAAGNQPDSSPSAPPSETKPESASPQEPATAEQLENVEKQMTGFEKATLRWAKAAVIMSGLAAIFVCLQWWEMHTGSADTHNLAVAAKNQATWTQRLSEKMQTQSDETGKLVNQMAKEAKGTRELAEDNHSLLLGTQAAIVAFSASIDPDRGRITFSANNEGKVSARDVDASVLITVRNWPDKSIRLGPFRREYRRKFIATNDEHGRLTGEEWMIPDITPSVSAGLSNGTAYITIQWKGSYDNGFGTRTEWPDDGKERCDASMSIGTVKCSSFQGGFGTQTTCDNIAAARTELESRMQEAKKQCQRPN